MDSLDTAALRRFDLKIHFDYLKPEQAWIMFQDAAHRLGFKDVEGARASLRRGLASTPCSSRPRRRI